MPFANAQVNLPNQPSSVGRARGLTNIPQGDLKESGVAPLLTKLRSSEVKKDRAIAASQEYHRFLQCIYSRPTQQPGLLDGIFGSPKPQRACVYKGRAY